MRAVSNLANGRVVRSAFLLVPTAVSILALGGVAALPALSLRDAREQVALAEHRAEQARTENARNEALQTAHGIERISDARKKVATLVPELVADLDLHTALRVAAELQGLEVETVSLGDLRDPGFPRTDDMIVMQDVVMSATGELPALFATLKTLEGLGVPVSVLEFSFERIQLSSRFSLFVSLGLFQRTEPWEAVDEESQSEEGSP